MRLVGGEWSASHLCRFTPVERAPGTHWVGGWMDPRAGLNDVEKSKFLTLLGLELWPLYHPAHSQSLYRLHYLSSPFSVMCYDLPKAETAQCQCSNNIKNCATCEIKTLGMIKMGKIRTSLEVLMCAWKLKAFTECCYQGVNKNCFIIYIEKWFITRHSV
jgi:hypothetical protein